MRLHEGVVEEPREAQGEDVQHDPEHQRDDELSVVDARVVHVEGGGGIAAHQRVGAGDRVYPIA